MAADIQNIQVRPVNASWDGVDLGYLDGDVEIKITESLQDIKTHQTGDQVIGNVRTGLTAEVTINLKETSIAQLKSMVTASGDSMTPAGGTEVFGWGTSKIGSGTFANAKRLVLHGVNDGANRAKDYTFWKAYPVLESIKLSGTEFQTLPVTFKCYIDTTKDSKVCLGVIGDSTQDEFADGTRASGTIAFASQPAADDTITVNGVAITFKASGAAGDQVNIGASKEATAANLLAFLASSANAALKVADYAIFAGVIMITYKVAGADGNAFTLAASDDFVTLSGATLAGGS
jgi:hypothetical protein